MYYNWKENIDENELNKVARKIRDGGLVVFPTETVYGIGANALDESAVKKIFKAKGRPNDNPLIVHVSNKSQIKDIVSNLTPIEEKIIDNFMPGPISLIVKKNDVIPDCVSAGLDTIAIRMPDNIIARKIIENAGVPIAAPSANVSGKPSGTIVEDIIKELGEKVDYVIDGGKAKIGVESTVLKIIDGVPIILRPGFVTPEQIKSVIGDVKIDDKVFEEVKKEQEVESPGMKYKHYAPNTKCKLLFSNDENTLINKINELILEYKNVVVIGFKEHENKIRNCEFISIGSKDDFSEISSNIYTTLRKADKFSADIILIEGVKKEGIGIAIMNRLLRTCGFDYLEI